VLATVWRSIGQQLRKPSGRPGHLTGTLMGVANARANAHAIAALTLGPHACVVELGCGPGFALRSLLRSPTVSRAIGIDWSKAMLADAARRNKSDIASGRLSLIRGDFACLPLAQNIADAILAVNVAYFMNGTETITEACRVLKPGGRLVLYATEASAMQHWPFAEAHTHRLFDRHGLADLLAGAGLSAHIDMVDAGFGIPGLIAVAVR
jgi:ubiquinone/menaquinone biosynthesis C-methylase UbiE